MLAAAADLLELKRRLKSSLKREQGEIKIDENNSVYLLVRNSEKIKISINHIHLVILGDKVQAIIRETTEGEKYCEPERLIGKPRSFVLGKIFKRNDHWFVSPIGSPWIKWKLSSDKANTLPQFERWCEQDWVQINLLSHPLIEEESYSSTWDIKCVQWIGHKSDPFLMWRYELTKAGLSSENIIKTDVALESENIAENIRKDYTTCQWISIDSAHTKDVDDALCINERDDTSYELLVAITDVDELVKEESLEDKFARQISASVYCPGYTVPMLPSAISEKEASLILGQKRPAIILRLICDKTTHELLKQPEFELGIITVKEKWSYSDVEVQLDLLKEAKASTLKGLSWMWSFAQKRIFNRIENNSIFLNKKEYEYFVNSKGRVENIQPKLRLKSEKLIESIMVFANECFCNWSIDQKISNIVYTTQSGFASNKLKSLEKDLRSNGLYFSQEELQDQKKFVAIQTFFRKMLNESNDKQMLYHASPAELTALPLRHYCLGLSAYATWTSPLRKYSDLINLRALKQFLLGKKISKNQPEVSTVLLQHLNDQRKKIRQCQRAVLTKLSISYLKKMFQEKKTKEKTFIGQVISIHKKGLTVFVETLNMEFLITFADLTKTGAVKFFESQHRLDSIENEKKECFPVLNKSVAIEVSAFKIQKNLSVARYLFGLEI